MPCFSSRNTYLSSPHSRLDAYCIHTELHNIIILAFIHTGRSPARYVGLKVGRYRFQVLPVGCDNGKRLSVRFDVF